MPGKLRPIASVGSFILRLLVVSIALMAILLLVLLVTASANTTFFDRYYSWLYVATIVAALVFIVIVVMLAVTIFARWRQGKFGSRLLAKLALFFALVGVMPGAIIYIVSYQFASRSIESWFDVNVETALTAGLTLGRGMLDATLSDLQTKGRMMSEQIANADSAGRTLMLLRLRDQFGVQDATVIEPRNLPGPPGMKPDMHVVAYASSDLTSLVPTDLPTPAMIDAARDKGYAAIEGEVDGDPHLRGQKGALRLRVVQRIPNAPLLMHFINSPERFLQLTAPVPPTLAHNADAVQRAYREYQEKSLGRTGLRKMYIGTLTLALFLATFIAIMLALALGNQLVRPLFLLAQGTKEVTEGDYTPKGEIRSRDELGFLTQSFNAMTRQLSEAHIAVEKNRTALEHSNAYLESILENLTAGVFVLDRQFRLQTTNPGAERIFHQSFHAQLGTPLDQIAALAGFAAMVRKAFADNDAASGQTGRNGEGLGHWQQQFSVSSSDEANPVTLLARGARLVSSARAPASSQSSEETNTVSAKQTTSGYVIVFDDISDVISAQRSIAWGEVARRLAHEIKNPLTPIQLSAERLQRKLASRLSPADADVLRHGANTIVSQVEAMKQMVNDFRDYARTPPAVLTPLQLNDLVSEVMTLYGIEESKSGIHVELAPLPMIRGDATQLRQVIHNLLQNAQDAVADRPGPHVVLETRAIEYGAADDEGHARTAVRLSVSDNGPGFSPGLLARAFEPYVTTKAKGTGLGLAVVRKIVDEHGARINLHNRTNADGSVEGAQISILFLQLASETGKTGGATQATATNPTQPGQQPATSTAVGVT